MVFLSGVDFISLGNHTFKRPEIMEYLDKNVPVIRPYNFPVGAPGKGVGIIDKGRFRVAVINMQGTVYSDPLGNPFLEIDKALKETDGCKTVIVDFHAEATAEKRAMGFYLDGKVSAVFGTHPASSAVTNRSSTAEKLFLQVSGYVRFIIDIFRAVQRSEPR